MTSLCSRDAVWVLLLWTSTPQAQETLLVCEGLTMETTPGAAPEALDHEISVVLYDDHVEVSDTGAAVYSVHEGIVWVWTRARAGEDYLYNLDTVSGRLRTIVRPVSGLFESRKIDRILTYQCRRVSESLVL